MLKRVFAGAIAGGILGFLISFIETSGAAAALGLSAVFSYLPLGSAASGVFWGTGIGGTLGGLTYLYTPWIYTGMTGIIRNKARIQIREQRLDISKEKIRTGSVIAHKETFTHDENITVPVRKEDLIVETEENGIKKTHRIPLAEERIEIVRNTVPLTDIRIYKRDIDDVVKVTEEVLREELRLEKSSDSVVVKDGENDSGM